MKNSGYKHKNWA